MRDAFFFFMCAKMGDRPFVFFHISIMHGHCFTTPIQCDTVVGCLCPHVDCGPLYNVIPSLGVCVLM